MVVTRTRVVRSFAATGRISPYVKQYRLNDGTLRWMLFSGRDFGDGTICEYCIDINDIQRERGTSELEIPSGADSRHATNPQTMR